MPPNPPPKISICIPVYNQTTYLKKLLESIYIQKFTDFDIIVSDDSTTDEVNNLIRNYNSGGKLKYFRNKQPLGSPANWNAAIQKATGKYVKIMHHDDAFTSDTSLSEMFSFIEAHGYDYIFTDTKVENVSNPEKSRIHRIRKLARTIRKPYLLFLGNSIGAPSTLLLKREPFVTLLYDTNYIWLVDIEYYMRLFRMSSNGSNLPATLILTHSATGTQITSMVLSNFELQIKEHIMLYNYLLPETPFITKFFMQVCMVRLFFRAGIKKPIPNNESGQLPTLLRIYFFLKPGPFSFIYYILIRALDLLRKKLYY